jgi:hypothetical protein
MDRSGDLDRPDFPRFLNLPAPDAVLQEPVLERPTVAGWWWISNEPYAEVRGFPALGANFLVDLRAGF